MAKVRVETSCRVSQYPSVLVTTRVQKDKAKEARVGHSLSDEAGLEQSCKGAGVDVTNFDVKREDVINSEILTVADTTDESVDNHEDDSAASQVKNHKNSSPVESIAPEEDSMDNFSKEESGLDMSNIKAENCVQFSRGAKGENEIKLMCELPMTEITVIAETRLLEVFGDQQFLTTAKGELFDSFDGTNVYTFNIKVDGGGSNVLTLRIPGVWETVWFFSIAVTLSERTIPSTSGNFNLASVDQLLSSTSLSKNAKNFKFLFENFQKNPPGYPGLSSLGALGGGIPNLASQSPHLTSLGDANFKAMAPLLTGGPSLASFGGPHVPFTAQNLEQAAFLSNSDNVAGALDQGPPTMADLLANPALVLGGHPGGTAGQNQPAAEHEPAKSELDPNLQKYIDAKFVAMEASLGQRLEAWQKETDRKLDLILEKLGGPTS